MQEFSDEILKKAFLRANMRCQCEKDNHDHGNFTCFKQLIWENRGNKTESSWEVNYLISPEKEGKFTIENFEILCWKCYNKNINSQ
jgi:hypothetical protein